MFKSIRTLIIGIIVAILTIATSATAQAANNDGRTVIHPKKETDSAVTVVNMAYDVNVTDTVLTQLGLSAADGWSFCFADNPEEKYEAGAYVAFNQLYVNAWSYTLQPGETQLMSTVMVQACTRTKITTPQRLSILAYGPVLPTLDTYLTKGNRCRVEFSNMDEKLVAYLYMYSETDYNFYWNRTVKPGASARPITLKHSAPATLTIGQSLWSSEFNNSGVTLSPLYLDTKSCMITGSSTSPITPMG